MEPDEPTRVPSDPWIGRRFGGRYRSRALVAVGSTGRVYEAEQEPLGRSVAVKILQVPEGERAARAEGRFLREASLLARLSHPNTVRVFDYGFERDMPFLVMELVRGRTLEQVLEAPMEPLRAIRIARQICGSLTEAHEVGLVHRDLKPANVLVAHDIHGHDHVKVVDFGLVKEVRDAVHMTGEGVLAGTPMYMAPEQIRGRRLDQRVDIYALGVLLFRALTGDHPFAEDQTAAILVAHLTDAPRTFREVAADLELPGCVEWTVRRCLEKAPGARFATVRELDRALELCEATLLDPELFPDQLHLVEGRLVPPETRRRRSTLPRPPGTRRLITATVLVVGCTLAAAFAFVLQRGFSAAAIRVEPVEQVQPAPEVPPAEPGLVPVRVVEVLSAPEPEPAPDPAPVPLDVRTSDLVDPWSD